MQMLNSELSAAIAVINRHVAWREADANYYYTAAYPQQLYNELRDACDSIKGAEYLLTSMANDLYNDFASYVNPENMLAYYVKRDILTKKAVVPVAYDSGVRLVYAYAWTQSGGDTYYYHLEAHGVTSHCVCVANEFGIKFSDNFVLIVNNFVSKHVSEATNAKDI